MTKQGADSAPCLFLSTIFSWRIGRHMSLFPLSLALVESAHVGMVNPLIVEDNVDLSDFIRDIFKDKYRILQAKNGDEGLGIATATIPDLIISDVMMPKMDGYTLCKELKNNDKTNHIPIILLTAKASTENKLEGLETGADDYLVKPFHEEELFLKVKNLIRLREILQKKYQGELWQKPKAVKAISVQQKFIEKIKKVIAQNLSNDQFGVEDLASEMSMSRSQMHRKLKAITNKPATAIIRNYRLYRAADLIMQDAGNITEIAYTVGFSSQSYFTTTFTELFGVSPTAYKEQRELGLDHKV
jgi:DNA-binding response OmpR family regulator